MKTYENISLKPYNTFGIDVCARKLLVIEPGDEVPPLEGEVLVIGVGSNMVFTKDYEGTVVILAKKSQFSISNSQFVTAWAGTVMDDLIQWTLDHNLYGLENLSAIPGTVGASAVQNVGAYGAEAKDLIESGLPHDTAQQLREAITEVRWSKLPRPEEHGSAGSFFKNPVVDEPTYLRLKAEHPDMPEAHRTDGGYKLSAGWLIDRAGWKDRTQGRAGVWPKNALVLYNADGCTGDEVRALAATIQQDVKQKFGVTLDPEAIIV